MSDNNESPISTDEGRVSYGIGRQMGDQLRDNSFDGVDIALVQRGLGDAFNGVESAVSNQDLQAAFQVISEKVREAQAEQHKELAAEGEQFLTENAKRDEVIVLESGLQYEVLEMGEGEKPVLNSTVRTHYHGSLVNGTVFDSSVERGQPAEFPVSGVISGWTEALQLMPTGSKWRLYVPYQLAYGEQGSQGAIPPFAALIFEVQLLDIL
ncbi:FKBP-type peptidyl-prolyl cis-trans isomerase [Aestuariirhabdus sp. Z084]|uniref:FKBP-type peptidyl-prolyl cis-trans isomerase n=1 Tax=Aestuariirhabdus haliotis TaxID=2918751 RepID=UPI00201B44F2|nr:FKBP-type peptidyl-prolyl cis-trans isomerase [Aestuariirhabdus haliotis]MCL6416203.1 FKBP-type peptidyl-prolyl cis-trans isomerase [Aestuariirhabdus haliotis]MCL6420255.1 FKBP-type peptidyl-prolyl cis-trans isomerase [Aestuariirhabdus haliotis]